MHRPNAGLPCTLMILALLLGPGVVRADEGEEVVWRDRAKVLPHTEAVLEALEGGKAEALKTLAREHYVDPWLVAELLVLEGKVDAARAWAQAAQDFNGNDVAKLPAYLEARGTHPKQADQRDALRRLYLEGMAVSHETKLELTAGVDPKQETVLSMELRRFRAQGLTGTERRADAHELLRGVAAGAQRLGWLRGATTAHYALAGSARNVRDLETDEASIDAIDAIAKQRARPAADALALHARAWFLRYAKKDAAGSIVLENQELAIWQDVGEPASIAASLINLGNGHLNMPDYPAAIDYFERGLAAARKARYRPWAANALTGLGLAHFRQGQNDTALGHWEKALVLQQAEGDAAALGTTYGNIALIYWRRRDLVKALDYSRKSAEAYELAAWPGRAAASYEGLGLFYSMRGAFAEASEMFQRAIKRGEEARDAELVARVRMRHTTILLALDELEDALAEADRAIEGYKALDKPLDVAASESARAEVLPALGRAEEAVAILEEVRERQDAGGDVPRLAMTLSRLAQAHEKLGDLERATVALDAAIEKARSVGSIDTMAQATAARAGISLQMGKYDEAIRDYEVARQLALRMGRLDIVRVARQGTSSAHLLRGERTKALQVYRHMRSEARAAKNKAAEAEALDHIANLQVMLGQRAKALSTYDRALKLQTESGDRAGAVETQVKIGTTLQVLGRLAKALTTLETARDRARQFELEREVALAEGALAMVYEHLGDSDKAVACLERAMAAHERRGDRLEVARSVIHLGNAYKQKGRLDEAMAAYEQGRETMRALGQRPYEAVAVGNIAGLHAAAGAFDLAEAAYREALSIHETMASKGGVAVIYYGLGDLAAKRKQYAEAREHFEKAVSVARSVRETFHHVAALTRLVGLRILAEKPGEALALAEKALAESETLLGGLADAEGAALRPGMKQLFGLGVLAATRVDEAAAAVRFLERGRAGTLLDALDQRDAMRWSRESLPPSLLELERAAQATEAAALAAYERARRRRAMGPIRKTTKVLEEATERRRAVAARIQRALKQEDSELYLPRRRTSDDMQAALEPHEALVLYGYDGPWSTAVVIRDSGARIVELAPPERLEAVAQALDLADRETDPTEALAAARKVLVEPLGLGKDVTRVIISPAGVLSYVPFGALFTQTVALTPSGTTHVILREEAHEPGTGILSLGDPVYGGAGADARRSPGGAVLAPLPATRAEAEGIGTTVLLGPKATEGGLRASLPKEGRLRAIHFACHGLVDEERPDLSSLALSEGESSDGFLTVLEIRRMDIPADLAVLSACETGRGRIVGGEGLMGMSRAFMFAGAPRVICSLWKVDDEATQALMLEFYRLWHPKDGSEGVSAAEALRKAQAHVRAKPRWKHPYYWAAWVLWGLPE